MVSLLVLIGRCGFQSYRGMMGGDVTPATVTVGGGHVAKYPGEPQLFLACVLISNSSFYRPLQWIVDGALSGHMTFLLE